MNTEDKLNRLKAALEAYDVQGIPTIVSQLREHKRALAEVRKEVASGVPEIDFDADDIQGQYLKLCHAHSMRLGQAQIDDAKLDAALEERLSAVLGTVEHRLPGLVADKVAADLESLDDGAMSRLLLLLDALPYDIRQHGLPPTCARLLALVDISGPERIASAAAQEFIKTAHNGREDVLRKIKDGEIPLVTLSAVGSLEEVQERRARVAELLDSAAA